MKKQKIKGRMTDDYRTVTEREYKRIERRKIIRDKIIAVFSILIIIAVGIISVVGIDRTTYHIFQEQCHNESQIVGYEDYNFKTVSYEQIGNFPDFCNYLYRHYTLDSKRDLADCHMWQVNVSTVTSHYPIRLEDGTMAMVDEQNYTEYTYVVESKREILKEVEVCEKVEIQKVGQVDAWTICWKDNISEKDFVQCSVLLNKNSFKKDYAGWLNNNCECTIVNCNKGYSQLTDKYCHENGHPENFYNPIVGKNYCQEYKCGDYSVEVQ